MKNIEKADQIIKFFEETSVSAYDECQKIIEAGKNNPSSNKGSRDLQYMHNKLSGRTLSYVKNNALSIVQTVKKHSDIIKFLKGKPDADYFYSRIKVVNKNF